MVDYDVVIVGGGPAGMTAGIYCVRRKLKAVVIERGALGGQMNAASEVENWPGDRLVSGKALAQRMAEHAKSLGVGFMFDDVVGLELKAVEKQVFLRGSALTCGAVILATGGAHVKMKLKGEEEHEGRGVSYCATCDGPFYKGKAVAVIGGGNMAVEDALYLAELSSKTYLVAKTLSAEASLMSKLEKSSVDVVEDSVSEIGGGELVESVTLASGIKISVQGVFVSLGHTPSTELAGNSGVELDGRGYVKVGRNMETNLAGVFAAGDVTGGIPQIASAVGEGCTAAMRAYQHIKSGG